MRPSPLKHGDVIAVVIAIALVGFLLFTAPITAPQWIGLLGAPLLVAVVAFAFRQVRKRKHADAKHGRNSSAESMCCSFCGKSNDTVAKLIAGPAVFVCDECVDLCMDIIRDEAKSSLVREGTSPAGPRQGGEAQTLPLFCSFCGKSEHDVHKLIAGPGICICDECVELCSDIIAEENKAWGKQAIESQTRRHRRPDM